MGLVGGREEMEEVRVAQDLLHNDLLLITSFFVFAFVLFHHFFLSLSSFLNSEPGLSQGRHEILPDHRSSCK